VDSETLNFFLPFRRLEPHHENQLTRALLVVLRYSPLAHAAWLRLAVPGRELHQLAAAAFRTQTRAVRYAEEADEPADLVSVFLAPEAPLTGGAVLTESDRTQVLDAVIDYGGESLVVVENKVAEDDDLQARELNTTGARVRLADGQEAVVVLWRDVIEAFIAMRERALVADAEALLLDDFLTYVENYFPALGPFRTLGLARGNRYRQHRRLRQLLGEATGLDAVTRINPYDIPALARFVIEHQDDLFFVKALDWKGEHEFRVIHSSNEPSDDGYVHVPFRARSLRAVIVGERFANWQLPAVRAACDQAGVQLLRIEWRSGLPHPTPVS
jgi:hypothetical protein